MLIFCALPFLDSDMLSNISGISEAIGAKKKASNIGLTFSLAAMLTTEVINGLEKNKNQNAS